MTNGRILHLATDEKFIDMAHRDFESAYPGLNDWMIFFDSHFRHTKHTPHRSIRYRHRLGFRLYRDIAKYDLVIVHSLHPFWVSVVNGCRRSVVFVWIGWGYDYYDLIRYDRDALLLPLTRSLRSGQPHVIPKKSFSAVVRTNLEGMRLNKSKLDALQRFHCFAPVLPNEYELVRNAVNVTPFPLQTSWNYGNIDDDYGKNFSQRVVTGTNIRIGNSASITGNHVDILDWLATIAESMGSRSLICPLSYGDMSYATQVTKFGECRLGNRFVAERKFVPLSQYINSMLSCSHLIMNNLRQEGVGNILIALYLGMMVFLREENPAYSYFTSLGYHVYSIQKMIREPGILNSHLTEAQTENNKRLLARDWSRAASKEKTRRLVQSILPNFRGSIVKV